MNDCAEAGRHSDEILAMYDIRLEVYRKDNDIMYKLMDGTEMDLLWNHLDGVIKNLVEQYGPDLAGMRDSIAYSKQRDAQAQTQGDIPSLDKIMDILKWMRDSEDANVRMAFWFFALYTRPPISRWMIETAPLNDRKQFEVFRDRVLAPESEKLIGGHGPSLDDYVRFLRCEYINRCGIPVPSTEEYAVMMALPSQDATL